eukprot:15065440-Alexandrium_andersonii.AAC.1
MALANNAQHQPLGRQRGRSAPVQSRAALCNCTNHAPRARALACRQQARAAANWPQGWASTIYMVLMTLEFS